MKFRSHTLDNGLEVVAECNDQAHSLAIAFYVRTGARDESDEVSGVSHFLEHMIFKGTPNRSADDVNRDFDEMGAHYNAYTTEESTVYYAAVLPEKQQPCVALLADILRPSLRDDDFNMEKEVIIEEIHMYDDQPPFGADDLVKVRYFGDHPLARSVLGTAQSIRDLSVEQMRKYFERRYAPGNLFVAAAGRVDFDGLVKQVESACGAWPDVKTNRETPAANANHGFDSLLRESATQQYMLQLAAGPAADDDRRFAAKLLATILGDDSGSRMYWDLVDSGVAEQASLGHYEYDGAGLFYTWASCEPSQAEGVLAAIQSIYESFEADGLHDGELEQAKSKIRARIVLGSERPRNRLFALSGNWAHRKEYRSVAEDLATIDAITPDAIHALIKRFPLTKNTTLTVGPRDDITAHSVDRR